ncbi:S9 family peptidase [Flavobacterium sp. GT3R68]|uniref:alpha/beta hydrolase family protein n=1 Tax=Flavobacterium sp. GT3R68 TaxID=2594437 RepID=UPI000F8909F0|nr:alpha/beta fold hydrolase [Flavobacterium sp. GT3R68]RTY95377.1 alpha/beta fold hydrolase [Flavobacterium sp. GSN2]TRW90883.1 alpha/beta fold hydrolase [Flavobacterium sp. GT3R68]
MRKIIFTVSILLFTVLNFAQTIEGNWNGMLEVQGTQLKLVFHVANKDGKLVSTMDSPDQKAFGIPVATTTFESNTINFELPNAKITYKGMPNADFSAIEGTFRQGAMELPLKLTKKPIEKAPLNRPQTPKEPFSYQQEEVFFENKIDKITLAGTLTYPKTKGKFPVVILITGSGAQDRNEELFEHKPFAVIADDLTKKGIAVLRFDDRGIGKSTGSFGNSTTQDFANDVLAAVDFLKTKSNINPKKIGLIGHSEGGMIAPIVAANSKDISFIVLMAGPGTPIDELMVEQNTRMAQLSGMSDEQIKVSSEKNKSIYAIIKNSTPENLEKELTAYLKMTMSNLSDEAVKNQVQMMSGKWFQYFIKYNPAENLSKVKCPVLAINGSLDFQVPSAANLKAIETALLKGKNKKFKTVELQGLNHLFQEAGTGAFEEYSKIEQTISPKALDVMSNWILQQTK